MRLSDFRVLTFDCYGTLIDWETGILAALAPLLRRAAPDIERVDVLAAFARHEDAVEREDPAALYTDVLARTHLRLARDWGVDASGDEAAAFARSVPDWPAFPDSPEALRYLERYFALVILSNVDRASFAGSNRRLGVEFDAIFTAEDIGTYKPDLRNFEHMLEGLRELGFEKTDVLHTAQSLYHDHVPANRIGLASAWIHRGHDDTGPAAAGHGATRAPERMPRVDFRFASLGEMAEAHRLEVGGSRTDGTT